MTNQPVQTYSDLGETIADGGWGCFSASAKEAIQSASDSRMTVLLLAAAVRRLGRLERAMLAMPQSIERARLSEMRSLEREKQKTARAQQKAAEAAPPVVNVVTASPREIAKMLERDRVMRKF